MNNLSVTSLLKKVAIEWSEPRVPQYMQQPGAAIQFHLQCWMDPVEVAHLEMRSIPQELQDFWASFNEVTLFRDRQYGGGLHLLGHQSSRQATDQMFVDFDQAISGDIVIGTFYNDPWKLVIRCDEVADDFGCVFIASQVWLRQEWYAVGNSLLEFLERLAQFEGLNFWEPQTMGEFGALYDAKKNRAGG